MAINDPLVISNVVLCTLVVIRLCFFRKNGAIHRRWAAWLAYLLVLAYGSVPIRFFFDHYHTATWASFVINAIICIAIYRAGGNVARLFSILRHPQ